MIQAGARLDVVVASLRRAAQQAPYARASRLRELAQAIAKAGQHVEPQSVPAPIIAALRERSRKIRGWSWSGPHARLERAGLEYLRFLEQRLLAESDPSARSSAKAAVTATLPGDPQSNPKPRPRPSAV